MTDSPLLGLYLLGILPITGVTAVVPTYGIFLIAYVNIHFTFKHLFQHLCMELFKELAHFGFCLKLAQKFFT